MRNKLDITDVLENIVFEKGLTSFFLTALSLDLPFAVWKKPNSEQITSIVQLSGEFKKITDLESSPEGFLFCPFDKNEKQEKDLIKADLMISSEESQLIINPTLSHQELNTLELFIKTFEGISNQKINVTLEDKLKSTPKFTTTQEDYLKLVARCVKEIKSGSYQKIVPSRRKSFDYKRTFNPINEFTKLHSAYPNAFVSLVYHPQKGLWLGATPEVLIKVDQNKFQTVSLAGTQGIPEDFDLSEAAWTQKEIEEQALVSRYIINCFKKIRLREFEEYGPKTVKAGNLIHLKTTFDVDLKEAHYPQLASVMLDLLHPTSAVCGMPMKSATNYLKNNEGYDRAYFSGYLGPVNIDNKIDLFVNIRCAQLFDKQGILYAGAGVTEDSNPIKEWHETEMKLKTLLNIINA